MKTIHFLAVVIVLSAGIAGCQKRDPKPTPQVVKPAVSAISPVPGGIAWFQGSIEEGFSQPAVTAGRPGESSRPGCLEPLTGDETCQVGTWPQSVRILSRLLQFVRLGL